MYNIYGHGCKSGGHKPGEVMGFIQRVLLKQRSGSGLLLMTRPNDPFFLPVLNLRGGHQTGFSMQVQKKKKKRAGGGVDS